jgi:hypothetical protein
MDGGGPPLAAVGGRCREHAVNVVNTRAPDEGRHAASHWRARWHGGRAAPSAFMHQWPGTGAPALVECSSCRQGGGCRMHRGCWALMRWGGWGVDCRQQVVVACEQQHQLMPHTFAAYQCRRCCVFSEYLSGGWQRMLGIEHVRYSYVAVVFSSQGRTCQALPWLTALPRSRGGGPLRG